MSRSIYLVRHGKIDAGEEKRYIGVTDLPLSAEGVKQAQKLKKFFHSINIEKAYVSPLVRCVQTADIIFENRDIERILVKEFTEINMGQWEGKTFKYIKSYFSEQFKKRGENIDTFVPPGGESFKQLRDRVIPVYENIVENSVGNIIIISHAGVNRIILSNLLSMPIKNIFQIDQTYGCIDEICYDDKYEKCQWKMLR